MKIHIVLFLLFAIAPYIQAQTPKHEVRAVWLTTIGGVDWPHSHQTEQQQQELKNILNQLQQSGINTVLVQTRVRGTTIYPSALEPWDGCLTGVPGRQPAYNPLTFIIDECHKRGMECHAWVVTIPVGKWNKIGCKQLRQKYPKLIKRIGEDGFMDPEQHQTGDYLASLCSEIVRNYDVDGIHLDYIRYPETWKIKVAREKGRSYITQIVQKIHRAVKKEKPWVRLTCSPIGKYDDLCRYKAGGWNARTAVCQEAQAWLRDGLMDGLFPMMYFQGNHYYPFAIDWMEKSYGRPIAAGLGIYFLDPREGKWTIDMVERQMNVARQIGMGHSFFRSKFYTDNTKGIYDFGRRFDATPALVPPMKWLKKDAPSSPVHLQYDGHVLSWTKQWDQANDTYLLYNIYASEDYPVDITKADNLVATRLMTTAIKVPDAPLNYAVTAMNRYGMESEAAQLQLYQKPSVSSPSIWMTNGTTLSLPAKDAGMDADFVIIENMLGQQIAICPYQTELNVAELPDGMYQVRSLGKKGRNHRIGYMTIKH